MATFEITNADTIAEILRNFGDDFDEIAVEMLKETTPILAEKVKANLPKEIDKYSVYQTIMKPKKTKDGGYVCYINWKGSTPRQYSPDLRNAELLAYWEYGTSKNQSGKGFMRRSVTQTASNIQEKMADIAKQKLEALTK